MSPKVQFVKTESGELAVLPRAEFERLTAAADMLADVAAYDRAVAANAGHEWISDEMMGRLINENPVRVWREHRGLSQADLARRAGIRQSYMSMIERGERAPATRVLSLLARALAVDVDDLLPNPEDDGTRGKAPRVPMAAGKRKPTKSQKRKRI